MLELLLEVLKIVATTPSIYTATGLVMAIVLQSYLRLRQTRREIRQIRAEVELLYSITGRHPPKKIAPKKKQPHALSIVDMGGALSEVEEQGRLRLYPQKEETLHPNLRAKLDALLQKDWQVELQEDGSFKPIRRGSCE